MAIKAVTKTMDAAAEATGWITPFRNGVLDVGLEMDSAWDGVVQLQKTRDGGTTVHVVKEYTTDAQESVVDAVPGVQYRLYCSERTDGSCAGELYKEEG